MKRTGGVTSDIGFILDFCRLLSCKSHRGKYKYLIFYDPQGSSSFTNYVDALLIEKVSEQMSEGKWKERKMSEGKKRKHKTHRPRDSNIDLQPGTRPAIN